MSDQSGAKPRGGVLIWALWGAALLGVAAVLYIMAKASTKAPEIATGPLPEAAAPTKTVLEKWKPAEPGQAAPDYAFQDAAGKPVKIADFKGKVVVANLWATWCAPCKVEMPTLAKLSAHYAGKPVVVMAISIDKDADVAKARDFIAGHKPLAFYNDPEAKLQWRLSPAIEGMPTTLVYGPDGLERGRVAGEADWSGPEARAVIDRVLAEAG